jgi:hypothetical protein
MICILLLNLLTLFRANCLDQLSCLFLGKVLSLICYQSAGLNWLIFQNRVMSFMNADRGPCLLRLLKESVRILFLPAGLFLNCIFWRAALISVKVGGALSAVLIGCRSISWMMVGWYDNSSLPLMAFQKWSNRTLAFLASVFTAKVLSFFLIFITTAFLWWPVINF